MIDRNKLILSILWSSVCALLGSAQSVALAGEACPEFCDRTNSFHVAIPSGWTAEPKEWRRDRDGPTPTTALALRLVSPSARATLANCPVISSISRETETWTLRTFPRDRRFWADFWKIAVSQAGFTMIGEPRVVRARASSKFLISYVEFDFLTDLPEVKSFTARQALYWMPSDVRSYNRPKPDDKKFVPARVHFVNCTSSNDAFASVEGAFSGVFTSFRPMHCVSFDSSSRPACSSPEDPLTMVDRRGSTAEPVHSTDTAKAVERLLVGDAVEALRSGAR